MTDIIDQIEQHANAIAAGEIESVRPGMPAAFTKACHPGDAIRQGDLYLVVADRVPYGYELSKSPIVQLVPGNTQGSKHCLDTVEGVDVYLPEGWNDESLEGPCIVTKAECKVLHPTHGHIAIPAWMIVVCHYQREWVKEEEKERRARD